MSDLLEIKTCPQCQLSKPVDAFAYQNKALNQRMSWCKECRQAARRVAVRQAPGPKRHIWQEGDTRVCTKCGETKTVDQFSWQNGSPRPDCKTCRSAIVTAKTHAQLVAKHATEGTLMLQRNIPPDAPRVCTACRVAKPQSEFYSKKHGHCKPCRTAEERERYAANPAPKRAQYERLRTDPAAVAEMRRRNSRYQIEHRVETTLKCQRWRHANPDKVVASHQRRRAHKMNAPRVERLNHGAIIARDNSTCYLWCKRKLARHEITFDHVIPLARGGSHTMDNLRVACLSCNSRKGTHLLSELDGL